MHFLRRLNRSVRVYGPAILILIKIAGAIVHFVHIVNGALTYRAEDLRASLSACTR